MKKTVKFLLAAYWLVTWTNRIEFPGEQANLLGTIAIEKSEQKRFDTFEKAVGFIKKNNDDYKCWGFHLYRFEERNIPATKGTR